MSTVSAGRTNEACQVSTLVDEKYVVRVVEKLANIVFRVELKLDLVVARA